MFLKLSSPFSSKSSKVLGNYIDNSNDCSDGDDDTDNEILHSGSYFSY